MAFLVKRGNVFHLEHRTADGRRVRFSTGLRTDQGKDVRAAKEMQAEYTLKERQSDVGPARFRAGEKWDAWLPGYIAMKFRNSPGTAIRFKSVLRTLRMFFTEHGIETPRQLTRQHCFDYFEWRKKPDPAKGKFPAVHNTALLEISALGTIMKEAVHRGFAPYNPCRELGIGRDEENKPMELTDAMLAELEAHIQGEPEPHRSRLWRSYIIARKHGVRLHEVLVNPIRDVRFLPDGAGEIDFYQKGGRKRTKPLHPDLVPLFRELQAQGATQVFDKPASWGAYWHIYIRKWNMHRHGKVSFHSLRVTVQNKLRRAGVNDEIRRAYLSHETKKDVHEVYSRIEVNEMRVCHPFL